MTARKPTKPSRVFWLCAAALALPLAGCGASTSSHSTIPRSVPPGAVAVVGSTPITEAAFHHWLALAPSGDGPAAARRQTVAFLVKAQWLTQEAAAEGVDHPKLEAVARRQVASAPPADGSLSLADRRFQARLDVIADALEQRHRRAHGALDASAVRRYYRQHRAEFRTPPVRETRMVVTRHRAQALKARARIESGRPWAAVARRVSSDSSRANGGIVRVARGGAQSPRLQRAVFTAPLRHLVGPLRAVPPAGSRPEYFLFEVTGQAAAHRQPRHEVVSQIRQRLNQERAQRALASFERSFTAHWKRQTLCAPGYVVPDCRNYATRRGPKVGE